MGSLLRGLARDLFKNIKDVLCRFSTVTHTPQLFYELWVNCVILFDRLATDHIPWQIQQVPFISPTNCQKCWAKASSTETKCSCYLYRQTVVFVTIKVFDQVWGNPTSCIKYWVYSVYCRKSALAWRVSPLESQTKAIHKYLAASPCVEKYCTSSSDVTKLWAASEDTTLMCRSKHT